KAVAVPTGDLKRGRLLTPGALLKARPVQTVETNVLQPEGRFFQRNGDRDGFSLSMIGNRGDDRSLIGWVLFERSAVQSDGRVILQCCPEGKVVGVIGLRLNRQGQLGRGH